MSSGEGDDKRDPGFEDGFKMVKDVFLFFFSSAGLVFLVALTIGMTSWALQGVLPPKENHAVVVQWAGHFLTALAITFVLTLTGLALSLIRPAWASSVAKRMIGQLAELKTTQGKLARTGDALEKKVVPAFLGNGEIPDTAGIGIIRALSDAIGRVQLFGQETFVYASESEHTERPFIVTKDLIERTTQVVRITGPMAGVVGKGGFDVVSHVCELMRQKILQEGIRDKRPFVELRLAVPAQVNEVDIRAGSNFYPMFARRFALSMLTGIAAECENKSLPEQIPRLDDVRVRIAFLDHCDLFPAIQMWDDVRLLVVPSIGIEDRYNDGTTPRIAVSEAVPFGIVVQKNFSITTPVGSKAFDLSATMERVRRYFDDTLFHPDETKETWILRRGNKKNAYSVSGFVCNRASSEARGILSEGLRKVTLERLVDGDGNVIKNFELQESDAGEFRKCLDLAIDHAISHH